MSSALRIFALAVLVAPAARAATPVTAVGSLDVEPKLADNVQPDATIKSSLQADKAQPEAFAQTSNEESATWDRNRDGIPDQYQMGMRRGRPGDMDGDGIPDWMDGDRDGDGIPDFMDSDGGTGMNNFGMGMRRGRGRPGDRDGDGIPDWMDSDGGTGMNNFGRMGGFGFVQTDDKESEKANDEPKTAEETSPEVLAQTSEEESATWDRNRDGIPDQYQMGMRRGRPGDMDGDGIPDWMDGDRDGDGIPDFMDSDGGTGRNNFGMGMRRGRPGDMDGDGIPDWMDSDGGTGMHNFGMGMGMGMYR